MNWLFLPVPLKQPFSLGDSMLIASKQVDTNNAKAYVDGLGGTTSSPLPEIDAADAAAAQALAYVHSVNAGAPGALTRDQILDAIDRANALASALLP